MELKKIFNEYNCYTGAPKIAAKQLEEYDKAMLFVLYALTGIALAYRYVEEDYNPWDDRNKASKKFAFDNKERFYEIFKKYAKKEFPNVEYGQGYITRGVKEKELNNPEYMEWLHITNTEHPTIMQSYFRGMTQVAGKELGLPDGTFPFI